MGVMGLEAIYPKTKKTSLKNPNHKIYPYLLRHIGATYPNHVWGSDIKISMDGLGRCMDNIFTERLWRSVKYEEVYLKSYENIDEARENLKNYFDFYNTDRPHKSLGYETPETVYANKKRFAPDAKSHNELTNFIKPLLSTTGV